MESFFLFVLCQTVAKLFAIEIPAFTMEPPHLSYPVQSTLGWVTPDSRTQNDASESNILSKPNSDPKLVVVVHLGKIYEEYTSNIQKTGHH